MQSERRVLNIFFKTDKYCGEMADGMKQHTLVCLGRKGHIMATWFSIRIIIRSSDDERVQEMS